MVEVFLNMRYDLVIWKGCNYEMRYDSFSNLNLSYFITSLIMISQIESKPDTKKYLIEYQCL